MDNSKFPNFWDAFREAKKKSTYIIQDTQQLKLESSKKTNISASTNPTDNSKKEFKDNPTK